MLRAVSDHPNAALVRRVWDAIARGDADALRAFLAPDLIWRATARGTPWAGTHRGADAAIDMLARVGEATDVFDAQLLDILASDARVLLLFRVRIVIGAREVELDYLLLAEVDAGCLTQIWSAALDPQAIEAFWGGLELARSQPR
jgi:ketosteroid isomerase-like protein